jgi:hypothetical protein
LLHPSERGSSLRVATFSNWEMLESSLFSTALGFDSLSSRPVLFGVPAPFGVVAEVSEKRGAVSFSK